MFVFLQTVSCYVAMLIASDCQEHYDRLSGREVVTGWLVSRHVDCIWIYKPWSTLWLSMRFLTINLKLGKPGSNRHRVVPSDSYITLPSVQCTSPVHGRTEWDFYIIVYTVKLRS